MGQNSKKKNSKKEYIDVAQDTMPPVLKELIKNLSPFERRYAEFRAKGMKQSLAAYKAGSKATTKESRGRVGYNTEQKEGVKDYIMWLEQRRAKASVIDQIEIAQKFRDVYDEAMKKGNLMAANKAAEHLATLGGFMGGNSLKAIKKQQDKMIENHKNVTKTNTEAFTQDTDETTEISQRLEKLQRMAEQAMLMKEQG